MSSVDNPAERIAIVVSSLRGGGTERVAVNLATEWHDQGRQVHVVTLDDETQDRYPLPEGVHRIALDRMAPAAGSLHGAWANLERIRVLRQSLKTIDPDVVLSFIHRTNVLTLLAARSFGTPVIVSERNHPDYAELPLAWRWLRAWTYPQAAALVVQTDGIRDRFLEMIPRASLEIIPNAVTLPDAPVISSPDPAAPPAVVAAGSLTHQKGFDQLLEAFAQVSQRHPDWRLRIFGEGPLRDALEAQARKLGLQNRVQMPGWTDEIYEELASASIFCLSSRHEGFPNVLLEAMAVGTPPVSFDCPTGPNEIVRSGKDGILVPLGEVDELADALCHLMDDPNEREAMGKRARQVRDRFAPEDVMERWDALVREVTT